MKIKICLFVVILFIISQSAVAMINPAAAYCTGLGYEYNVESTDRGDSGHCKLPNGETVEEWQFLQGKVGTEFSYCAQQGYETKVITSPERCQKFLTSSCTVCLLPDGSEVEVTDMMQLYLKETSCGDGSCGFPENHGTCPSDCPSGELDDYCDGVEDGRCDPECSEAKDADCVGVIVPSIIGPIDGIFIDYIEEEPGFFARIINSIVGLFK